MNNLVVEEKLEEQRKAIEEQISHYESLEQKKNAVLTQMLQMQEEISQIDVDISNEKSKNMGLSTMRVKNKFAKFLLKTFSQKYRRELDIQKDIKLKIENLKRKQHELVVDRGKLYETQKGFEDEMRKYDIINIKEKLEQQKDADFAIEMLLEEHPELAEDIAFMKDLVGRSTQYISYDKTDSSEVYSKFADSFESKSKKSRIDPVELPLYEKLATKLRNELENPKECNEGTYKIPHKYLFDAIKRIYTIKKPKRSDYEMSNTLTALSTYFKLDGKLPLEYGEKIQDMFEDEKSYLFMHKVDINEVPQSVANTRIKAICKEGLTCSGQGESHISSLSTTTVANYQDDGSFLAMLAPDNKVFMMIPKKAIDEEHKIPVWGADTPNPKYEKREKNYVLPEYVVGYIDKENTRFVDNPVPEEERTQYKYHFYEGEQKALDYGLEER